MIWILGEGYFSPSLHNKTFDNILAWKKIVLLSLFLLWVNWVWLDGYCCGLKCNCHVPQELKLSEGLSGLHICDGSIPWQPADASHELCLPVTCMYGLVSHGMEAWFQQEASGETQAEVVRLYMTQSRESQNITLTISVIQKSSQVRRCGRHRRKCAILSVWNAGHQFWERGWYYHTPVSNKISKR